MSSSDLSLPKISIIIPSFNQGVFIERTLLSIIDQNYPNIEIIVIDGGSTDETISIIESLRKHITIFISEKDEGQTDAIGKGFTMSTGEIITWINSDDTYTSGTLNTVGEYFLSNPFVRFLYGNRDYIDENDNIVARRRQPEFNMGVMLYAHMIIPQVSAFWRRSLYLEAGEMDKSFSFCMDYDLFIRLSKISPPVHISQVLGNFRLHDESKTATLELLRKRETNIIYQKYCRFKPKSIMFKFMKAYYFVVLLLIFVKNGGLMERLRVIFRGRVKSNIRINSI